MPRKHSTGLIDSSSNSSSEEGLIGPPDSLFTKVEEMFLGGLLEGKYLLESSIGKGSSSVVFAATDIKNLCKVYRSRNKIIS